MTYKSIMIILTHHLSNIPLSISISKMESNDYTYVDVYFFSGFDTGRRLGGV